MVFVLLLRFLRVVPSAMIAPAIPITNITVPAICAKQIVGVIVVFVKHRTSISAPTDTMATPAISQPDANRAKNAKTVNQTPNGNPK